MVPSSASIVNQVFVKFVSRSNPRGRSDLEPPSMPITDRMQLALAKLADFLGDPSIASRDPSSSLSFSGVSPEVRQSQTDALTFYGQGLANAFSPMRPDGRSYRKYGPMFPWSPPLPRRCRVLLIGSARRYSERREDHWFYAERDGISYAGRHVPCRVISRNRLHVTCPETSFWDPNSQEHRLLNIHSSSISSSNSHRTRLVSF